jgi:hypothetical protein
MRILSVVIVFFITYNASAQHKSSYCECEIKGVETVNDLKEKRVDLSASYSNGNINAKIINNTMDTVFIFKSYFDEDISNSPYLYRYNKKSNEVNVSYAPLLPYLYTKYSDKVIHENRILKDYQVVYDFYKIPPMYEYSFSIKALDFTKLDEFVKDFDVSKLNKFEKVKKFKKVKLGQTPPAFFVSIAYYKNIGTICSPNSYYQEELKFNNEAMDFRLLKSLLEVR